MIEVLHLLFTVLLMSKRSSASAEWIPIGSSNLKCEVLYEDLGLDLAEVIHFSACPFSGPMAICSSDCDSFKISIFNATGKPLGVFHSSSVRSMFWSRGHRLVIVGSNGTVSLHSPLGEYTSNFQIVRDVHIVSSLLFGAGRTTGIAVLDDNYRISVANSVDDPVIWNIHLPISDIPSTWTLSQANSQITCVVTVFKCTFYRANQGEQLKLTDTLWAFTDGSYVQSSCDWANEKMAFLHSRLTIHVTLSDLSSLLSRIELTSENPIDSIGWISQSYLFIRRGHSSLQIVSTIEQNAVYNHPCSHAYIGVEQDGLSVFTRHRLTFISPVSQDESDVLGVASSAEGAFLLEAQEMLDAGGGTRAPYEYILTITNLPKAVEECTNVASHTRNAELQKILLKAARLGMAFSNVYDSSSFVRLLRELRVVHECSLRRVGIPITHLQLRELSFTSLLSRLVDLDIFALAVKLSTWMSRDEIECDRVVIAWLKKMMKEAAKRKESAEAIDQAIANKLKDFPHVSYADVAEKALEMGAKGLAKLLIGREKNDERQVECLLRLGEVGEALARADIMQQPKLIHMVLRHLTKHTNKSQLELEIRKIPHAQCVYQEYVRQQSSGSQMLALLTQNSDFERKLIFHLDSAVVAAQGNGPFAMDEKKQALEEAKEAASALRDNSLIDLLNEAMTLTASSTRMAVIDAVADPEAVARIAKQAKLSDNEVHQWTVEGLARAHRWSHLAEFSKKKSPIGYAPFVKACVKYGRTDEAEKYLQKATNVNDQIEACLVLSHFVRAAKLAFDRRDESTLNRILQRSFADPQANATIAQMRDSL